MSYAIGVDIGGTYIKAGIVDKKGKIIEPIKIPITSKKDAEYVIGDVMTAVEKVIKAASPRKISGIGIGVPGRIDKKNGTIIDTPNLPLHGIPIKEILQRKFKKKVVIENDANCFGIAEAKLGFGRKNDYVLCITLGTGIGSAFIIKGKLYKGKGDAPELGHTTINFKGHECHCGNYGCVEEYISSRGLVKIARDYGFKLSDTLDLFIEAERGNLRAIKAFEEYGTMLGMALSNFVNTFDPEMIVLGGQISGAWRFFNKTMVRELNKKSFVPACKVAKTELKDAGVIGAGLGV
ncbi:ROK family protein [Candidatus Woesearchaeota archaeon]|nr:ROK family protein [Candidatus Woesearchaeota archaeon]